MNECAHERKVLAGQLEELRDVFTALGDRNRQSIFLALLDGSSCGMRVPQLTECTHLSRPAVSHHLKLLKEAGLVSVHAQGTKNFYYIDAKHGPWAQLSALVSNANVVLTTVEKNGYCPFEQESLR